jgi:hypothetical protein
MDLIVIALARSYSSNNYISPGSADYPYYVRKHNPLVIYDAVSQDAQRVKRIRTFNDFANDVVNGTLPQWVFVTPNMVCARDFFRSFFFLSFLGAGCFRERELVGGPPFFHLPFPLCL